MRKQRSVSDHENRPGTAVWQGPCATRPSQRALKEVNFPLIAVRPRARDLTVLIWRGAGLSGSSNAFQAWQSRATKWHKRPWAPGTFNKMPILPLQTPRSSTQEATELFYISASRLTGMPFNSATLPFSRFIVLFGLTPRAGGFTATHDSPGMRNA